MTTQNWELVRYGSPISRFDHRNHKTERGGNSLQNETNRTELSQHPASVTKVTAKKSSAVEPDRNPKRPAEPVIDLKAPAKMPKFPDPFQQQKSSIYTIPKNNNAQSSRKPPPRKPKKPPLTLLEWRNGFTTLEGQLIYSTYISFVFFEGLFCIVPDLSVRYLQGERI